MQTFQSFGFEFACVQKILFHTIFYVILKKNSYNAMLCVF
jgi:hypothetical protein